MTSTAQNIQRMRQKAPWCVRGEDLRESSAGGGFCDMPQGCARCTSNGSLDLPERANHRSLMIQKAIAPPSHKFRIISIATNMGVRDRRPQHVSEVKIAKVEGAMKIGAAWRKTFKTAFSPEAVQPMTTLCDQQVYKPPLFLDFL